MAAPVHIAAIDAGSNAIRLLIARALSSTDIEFLETRRYPVRLGHGVFTRQKLSEETIRQAVDAFRRFRAEMDRAGVKIYRAVATSASREAGNRRALVEAIRKKTGIHLEVIDGGEEARLVRVAVQAAVGHSFQPRLIVDLGGGSLELNVMRGRRVERSVNLPLGTVRLMETLKLEGALGRGDVARLRRHVSLLLRSHFPERLDLTEEVAVACGGNAEELAQIVRGPVLCGIRSLSLTRLRKRLWEIVRLDVKGRMRRFDIRKDRAEVIGIAAVVLESLARWAKMRRMLAPSVGVKEGVIRDLAAAHFRVAERKKLAGVREQVLEGARALAARLFDEPKHNEQVRRLAVSLFDQTQGLHQLNGAMRRLLEAGALLHDVGHAVSHKAHHRHGEYLVANAELPGLENWERDVVACLVRYHNNKSEPDSDHRIFSSLGPRHQQAVHWLSSLLRLAEALDRDKSQAVTGVETERDDESVVFRVKLRRAAPHLLRNAERKARMFEDVFGHKAHFAPRIENGR